MNTNRSASLALVVALVALPGAILGAQDREVAAVEEATVVFQEITEVPEKTIPEFLMQDAQAIAIIPRVIKVGFVVGGEYGRGVLCLRQQDGGWTNPIFVTLSGGSIGWQVGAQSSDIVLVFKTPASVEGILQGKFTIGVDAAAAAGPVGRRARASTDMELTAEIFSYSRSRGFFAGLSLDGAVLQIDRAANEAFYSDASIGPAEIRKGQGLNVPPAGGRLRGTLEDYTRSLPQKKIKI
jgi:lipid-binding SYLF domain-containing protein